MSTPADSPWPARFREYAVALLILAVGAALRFFQLGQNSLWGDEVASLRIASEQFWTIPAAALRHDAFEPPLYFMLLHLLIRLLGDGEASLRLLSAVAGALTVPFAGLLAWELSRRRSIAVFCAVLLAINPLHIWYSQEARPYALLVFFNTAALWALASALRTRSRWHWVMFAILAALGMLTHPAGGVVLVLAWIWVLLRPDRWSGLRPLVLSSVASLILIAPSYVALAGSVGSATSTGSPERPLTGLEIPYTFFTYLGGYSFGPSVREIQDTGWSAAVRSNVVQLGIGGLVLLLAAAMAVANRGQVTASVLALMLLPGAMTLLGSAATTKAYNVRYTVLGVVGMVVLLSAAIVPLRRPLRLVAALALLAVSVWADLQWYRDPRYRKDDARAAIAWLRERLPPGATIAVAPAYARTTLAHYARRSGAEYCFVPAVADGSPSPERPPDALLITRLHHVSEWRDLEAAFARSLSDSLRRGEVIGYRLLARATDPGGVTRAPGIGGC